MPREAPNDCETDDALGGAALLEALGAGLGRAEMADVAAAAARLGRDARRGAATVRFFGKLLGTAADYYVLEATLRAPPPEPPADEQAPLGAPAPGGFGGLGGLRLCGQRNGEEAPC